MCVLQRLGLWGDLRLVVLGSAVLFSEGSQLRELFRILEHRAVVELLRCGHEPFYADIIVALLSTGGGGRNQQIPTQFTQCLTA